MTNKLHRSTQNRILGGVCAGLGEYFEIDPTLVRIIFVLLGLWGGLGVLAYIILYFIMPTDPNSPQTAEAYQLTRSTNTWLAGGLILVGLLIFFDNLGLSFKIWPSLSLGSLIVPVLVIYLGIWLLTRKK